MAWHPSDMPDQSGRTAIVTGSNTGLGFETAAELARAGATVVLACRSESKAAAAKAEIEARHPDAQVELLGLDLSSLTQIREAAAETRQRFPNVDLLINNAGVMIPPKSTTADGFELQFGTNHLGHFAYTGQILLSLLDTPGSRIVNVSSIAHKGARINWDDLQWERRYSRQKAYGQSKLANLLFTFELDRRLRESKAKPICLAAHPGVSATELGRYIPGGDSKLFRWIGGKIVLTPAQGARPSLRAATDPDAQGSEFYGVDGPREMTGRPVMVIPDSNATRQDDQVRLWEISEELTGVTYPV